MKIKSVLLDNTYQNLLSINPTKKIFFFFRLAASKDKEGKLLLAFH